VSEQSSHITIRATNLLACSICACAKQAARANLKGKSLAPLRTEELNLVLKPLDKETYQTRPRILYIDESGKYRSHEPEPGTIVVKELGIKMA